MGREAALPNQPRMDKLMQQVDAAAEIGARGACKDRPDLFVDYENPLGDHSEAKRMCDTCDIAKLCGQWAREVKPSWGIWQGRIWVKGRTRKLREVYSEEDESDGIEELRATG